MEILICSRAARSSNGVTPSSDTIKRKGANRMLFGRQQAQFIIETGRTGRSCVCEQRGRCTKSAAGIVQTVSEPLLLSIKRSVMEPNGCVVQFLTPRSQLS
jgi:hypothetical protein